MPQRGGLPQVQTGAGETGGGDVDVAVDEGRSDEQPFEVDDGRVRKLRLSDVVAAEPGDQTVTDRHRGGVGHGGAVHAPVEQQGGCHGLEVSGAVGAKVSR